MERRQRQLFDACNYGDIEAVKRLCSHPCSIDVNYANRQGWPGWTPLCIACLHGHMEIIKYLCSTFHDTIDVNKETDRYGWTPLFLSCNFGRLEIVKYLCSTFYNVIDVNRADNDKQTPLSTACYFGHIEIVQFLGSLEKINVD
jgi:ankyrin repeat protein